MSVLNYYIGFVDNDYSKDNFNWSFWKRKYFSFSPTIFNVINFRINTRAQLYYCMYKILKNVHIFLIP